MMRQARTTEILDLRTLAWIDGPSLPQWHGTHAASVRFGDSFLVIGGDNDATFSGLNNITEYVEDVNGNDGSWVLKGEMSVKR